VTAPAPRGLPAARARVEALYAAVDRLAPEALTWTSMPRHDPEERTIRLAALERVADRAGRGALLDEARGWLREAVVQRSVSRGSGAEVGVFGIPSLGRTEDIVAVRLALEDAVSVAVVEDLLDPADAAALADPGRWLLGLAPLGSPDEADGEEPEPFARNPGWEPEAADWAAASRGGTAAVEPSWGPEAAAETSPQVATAIVGLALLGAIGAFLVTGALGGLVTGVAIAGVGWAIASRARRNGG
jgi:hypothetical protein